MDKGRGNRGGTGAGVYRGVFRMNRSVGFKIGGGFVFAAMILVVAGAIAYRNTNVFIAKQGELTRTEETVSLVHDLVADLSLIESAARGYIITGDDRYMESSKLVLNRLPEKIAQIRKLTDDDVQERKSMDAVDRLVTEKLQIIKEYVDIRDKKGFNEVQRLMQEGKNRETMEEIMRSMKIIEIVERDQGKRWDEETRMSARTTTASVVYGIPLALILLGLVGFFVTREISVPLNDMSHIAAKMAEGDLSLEINDTGREDEVGVLERAFKNLRAYQQEMSDLADQIASGNLLVEVRPRSEKDVLGRGVAAMVARMRHQLQQIVDGVNFLAATASEIMATTTQIASGATETATAVAETTTTIEELRQTVQVSSQKAKDVSQNAQQAAAASQNGRKAVDTAVEGMAHIRQQMESVADSIVKLSEQSQTISNIIASVNDIADQSNLLAVNAAIEAAKAGELGRGFAVVAQEVRALAEQSKQSTAQVRAVLNDVQKAISAAVMATEQSAKAVEIGMKQSYDAGDTIRILAEGVTASAHASVQILASANEQLIGMDQVAMAMESIKQASEQNLGGMKQAETAAQNLHNLGQTLKQLVEQYKL